MAGLSRMTAGIAGRSLMTGLSQLSRGQRPELRDMLLTPSNFEQFADQLARMRGAALKMGQLLSLDTGEVLPPELTQILKRLQADADHMPAAQLDASLRAAWGEDWTSLFERFDLQPMAAASIGQVHRGVTRNGRDLAIKIQYPGIAQSIDSDVDTMVALLRLTGLGPGKAQLSELSQKAKQQLHEEADYLREAENLQRYAAALAGRDGFCLPQVQVDLGTPRVLAMSYVPGGSIEEVAALGQDQRNDIVERLLRLALDELFEFNLVQSDPNFANYRYDLQSDRIGLIDFGATRTIDGDLVKACRKLLRAALDLDRTAIRDGILDMGLASPQTSKRHVTQIMRMIGALSVALLEKDRFDFASDDIVSRLQDSGMRLATDPEFKHVPPFDVLHLQRKFAGMYLLAKRLGANLSLRQLVEPYAG